ncbi:hypothetical protein O7606_05670 [Micromonospora sp. WMMD882]|uniref:hypothetical protein n=1 Tax=Micromonospora sp. WMMD882 TaxID=3015151 RepID=UPI00248AD1E3|nr:hypothetical protein [Micromonospora sp. WMMD882]WBB80873.1 hypothetical protein O7606_05670 [Micromonospora sp. WMMD882]
MLRRWRLTCSCGLPSWRRCPDRRHPVPPGPLAAPPRSCAERRALPRATDAPPPPRPGRNAGHWTRSPAPWLHRPARPSWRCRVDGAPWPCQPAKSRLLTLYADDRLALLMHLGALMQRAAGELPADVDVVDRFLLWARRAPAVDAGPVTDGDRLAG